MASVTRSSRRGAEGGGLHAPPHTHAHTHRHPHHHATTTTTTTSSGGNGPLTRSTGITSHTAAALGLYPGGQKGGGRGKRGLDGGGERDFEGVHPSKRSRIAVEILAKKPSKDVSGGSGIARSQTAPDLRAQRPRAAAVEAPTKQNRRDDQQIRPKPQQPEIKAQPTHPTRTQSKAQQPIPQQQPTVGSTQDANLTKHQAKVINGIKHELDRLQPQVSDSSTREGGRKLRSQEATRFKSELSAYFPDYDEVIGNDPKEQHILNADTPIILVDSNPKRRLPTQPQAQPAASQALNVSYSEEYPVRGYGDALFTDVVDAQRIDFGFLEAQHRSPPLNDPLPDSLFEPIHKRAERLERSIRNTEKGRAQHEKDQIIRLLEGLQGHDWLRVMGVSGVTETKKKTYEPARQYFVKGCQGILEKFKKWSLEEKRRKQEKDRALAELAEEERLKEEAEQQAAEGEQQQDESSDNEAEEEEDEDEEDGEEESEEADAEIGDGTSLSGTSEGSSPAKQLREEALARSKLLAKSNSKSKLSTTRRPTPPRKPPEPPKEFTSFFSKKYERDGALHRHRRAGRKVLAWGHPIPDVEEVDFVLPDMYLDPEMLKVRERKKRRDRRGSKQ